MPDPQMRTCTGSDSQRLAKSKTSAALATRGRPWLPRITDGSGCRAVDAECVRALLCLLRCRRRPANRFRADVAWERHVAGEETPSSVSMDAACNSNAIPLFASSLGPKNKSKVSTCMGRPRHRPWLDKSTAKFRHTHTHTHENDDQRLPCILHRSAPFTKTSVCASHYEDDIAGAKSNAGLFPRERLHRHGRLARPGCTMILTRSIRSHMRMCAEGGELLKRCHPTLPLAQSDAAEGRIQSQMCFARQKQFFGHIRTPTKLEALAGLRLDSEVVALGLPEEDIRPVARTPEV